MNRLVKEECTGCSACAMICPNNCIAMKSDKDGFLYPIINLEKCIGCNKCVKNCPVGKKKTKRKLFGVFAAISKTLTIRNTSSSGGFFYELSKYVIEKGGVVHGAVFDDNWNVYHTHAFSMVDIIPMMGSKYVQSDLGDTYKTIKRQLESGLMVLFSGTSCQCSGLKQFLCRDYDKLILLEVVCHGVPSPKVWNLFLREFCECTDIKRTEIKNIFFRKKVEGQSEYKFCVIDKNNNIYAEWMYENMYMLAFLNNLSLRRSCMNCKAKENCLFDFKVGDLWDKYQQMPFCDSGGTNLVLVGTKLGLSILGKLDLQIEEISEKYIDNTNSGFLVRQVQNPNRNKFFSKIDDEGVYDTVKKYSQIGIFWRIVKRINRLVQK